MPELPEEEEKGEYKGKSEQRVGRMGRGGVRGMNGGELVSRWQQRKA